MHYITNTLKLTLLTSLQHLMFPQWCCSRPSLPGCHAMSTSQQLVTSRNFIVISSLGSSISS